MIPEISFQSILQNFAEGQLVLIDLGEGAAVRGHLVQAANKVSAEAINFMALHGKGIVSLALDEASAVRLGLRSQGARGTLPATGESIASIEAREGVTTGISAADRARTIEVAVDYESKPDDLVSPGHVFPILARDGGVLVRPGDAESAVDLARLAGLPPLAAMCAVLDETGQAADQVTLANLAQQQGLPLVQIDQIISQRWQTDRILQRVTESDIETELAGKFRAIVYSNVIDGREVIALTKGEVPGKEPTLVRLHEALPLYDLIGVGGPRTHLLQRCLQEIAANGSGVVVLINNASPGLFARAMQAGDHLPAMQMEDFGLGAQVLIDLKIKRFELLTTLQQQLIGMSGFGLEITGLRQLQDRQLQSGADR